MMIHFPSRCVISSFFLISSFAFVCNNEASPPANRVSAFRIPSAKQVIKAQAGADGTIHVLFDRPDGPYYTKSNDDGATFSPPSAVVDTTSQKPGLKFSAAD